MNLVPPELAGAPVIDDLYLLAALSRKYRLGLHMEFGVSSGRSLRRLRSVISYDARLYGFDSFEGLPEAWNGFKAGSFATHLRVTLPNTELVVGPFEESIPRFKASLPPYPISLIHIDCDLYSSTRTVLSEFSGQIIPGTVILFDELFGYAGYERHEYRALKESGLEYEVLGRWNAYRALIRITR